MEQTQGERLAKAREIRHLSQSKLAELVGVSRGVIQNIEYNRANTMPAVITAICNALDIRQEWLINAEEPMETPSLSQNIILQEIQANLEDMTEKELNFILDVLKSMQQNFNKKEN